MVGAVLSCMGAPILQEALSRYQDKEKAKALSEHQAR